MMKSGQDQVEGLSAVMLLSREDARRVLGNISDSTLRRLIRGGALTTVRIGRRVLVRKDALEAFARAREA